MKSWYDVLAISNAASTTTDWTIHYSQLRMHRDIARNYFKFWGIGTPRFFKLETLVPSASLIPAMKLCLVLPLPHSHVFTCHCHPMVHWRSYSAATKHGHANSPHNWKISGINVIVQCAVQTSHLYMQLTFLQNYYPRKYLRLQLLQNISAL